MDDEEGEVGVVGKNKRSRVKLETKDPKMLRRLCGREIVK
jgi:hypothetical protein